MSLRRQPWLGLVSATVVIAVSLAFVSLFAWPTFRDWVSFYLVCTVPVAFVVGPFWHAEHPRIIARLSQPWRGLGFLVLTLFPLEIVQPRGTTAYPLAVRPAVELHLQ